MILVVSVAIVVHRASSPDFVLAREAPAVRAGKLSNETLPRAVAGMRDAILVAVQSGRLEDMLAAVELNEIRPDLGDGDAHDPVALWRTQSKDGSGRDLLEAVGKILAMPPAREPLGPDIENNAIYVWPYLAVRAASALTPSEEADLATLTTVEEAAAIKAGRRWIGWRIAIGADGVWHALRREK